MVRARPREPGAHGASDRGAAPEHSRMRARNRAPDRAARRRRARSGDPCRSAAPVAHVDAAHHQAAGGGRSHQRHQLFPPHLPAGAAAALCRVRARAEGTLRARGAAVAAAVSHGGQLDRRRSRRQPERARRRAALGKAAPYASVDELALELQTIGAALKKQGAALLAMGRLRTLQRKLTVFGFHLAPLDLRQSSDVHEAAVDELLARAGIAGYQHMDEPARVALLAKELASPRPLRSPYLEYSALLQKELSILDAAAEGRRRFGPRAVPRYVISHCESVSDLLEVGGLLREAGFLQPGPPPPLPTHTLPPFEPTP